MRGHADKCSVLRSGLLAPFQSWFLGEFLILFGCSIGDQVLDSNSGRLSTELGSETNAVFQRGLSGGVACGLLPLLPRFLSAESTKSDPQLAPGFPARNSVARKGQKGHVRASGFKPVFQSSFRAPNNPRRPPNRFQICGKIQARFILVNPRSKGRPVLQLQQAGTHCQRHSSQGQFRQLKMGPKT